MNAALMLLLWRMAEPGQPPDAIGYRVAASQAIVPGSVASQSRVQPEASESIVAGAEASQSR